MKPALLYKSNDLSVSTIHFLNYEFSEGEKVLENGRLYQCIPVESYTWKNNAAWLLGNIHHGRTFLLTSPLVSHFIFRADMPSEYSAWAREIACLKNAGYQITNINSQGFMTFSLPSQNKIKEFQIKKTMMDNKEIERALELVLTEVYERPRILVSNKDPTLKDFEYYSLILRQNDNHLKVFWIKNQKVVHQSIPKDKIKNVLEHLPTIGQSSDNTPVIKEILSNYNCTLIKKNQQLYISKQIKPSQKNCLIM